MIEKAGRNWLFLLGMSLALAAGIVGAMLLMDIRGAAPTQVEARAGNAPDFDYRAAEVRREGALATPSAVPVTGATGSVTPSTPGAAGRFEVRFTVSGTGGQVNLLNGTGTIVFTFDDDFQVPNSINRNDVSISTNDVIGGSGQPNVAVAPLDVAVDFVGPESDEGEVTLTVPDMDPSDGTGGDSIAGGATVTVVFSQAAGIRNSTEGGTRFIRVRTSTDVHDSALTVTIPILVELSAASGPRGTELTLLGRGYKDGTTLTFWRDADADGVRDTGEIDLCSATVGADDTGTCAYSVTNPPFDPWTFGGGGSCTFGAVRDCNLINAIDGRANTATITAANINNYLFRLLGSVSASPGSGRPGDTITVQLRDFPNEALVSVSLGGQVISVDAGGTPITSLFVPSSGELNFNIRIPNGVPPGVQSLAVATAISGTRRTNITVLGATVIPTPATVVPNQRISVTGTGFTGSATIFVITIGGQAISAARINDGFPVNIDAAGNWSASIDLPVNSGTTTPGTRELKVTDSAGRQGIGTLTFLERTITADPPEGGVGTDVIVKGANFPARNDEGSSVTITVRYDAGFGGTASATATPDPTGQWTVTLRVPSGAAIPSTNTIRAVFTDDSANSVITTITHRVPSATIAITPASGPPGTEVTVAGCNFRQLTPLTSLRIGAIDVTPSPRPGTNSQGCFSVRFTVPLLGFGTHTVVANIGGTTASAPFTVAPLPPDIEVTPWSFAVGLPREETDTGILRVRNTGQEPLEFNIGIVDTTRLPVGASSASSIESGWQPGGWGDLPDQLASIRAQALRLRSAQAPASPEQPPDVAQAIPIPPVAPIIIDPEGDATGGPPAVDIVRVDGGSDGQSLSLHVVFSQGTAMDAVVGYIHLDTDQDPATGVVPSAQFGGPEQDIGADFILDLFALRDFGAISVFDAASDFVIDVPAKVVDQSLQVSVPLSALGGDDGNVDVTMVLGNTTGPTDLAPDAGHGSTGPVVWLSTEPSSGTIQPGGSSVVAVTFDAALLVPGTYTADMVITSNDPDEGQVTLRVALQVTEAIERVCGDQNSDGVVDIRDVVIDLQIMLGLIEPTATQARLSDLNHDGESNVFDAILGLQHIVGLNQATECGGATSQ